MPDLKYLLNSDELKQKSKKSSKRWLDDDVWRPISIEEYCNYLDEIKCMKKALNAPNLAHPLMKGNKYSI